jgi:pseudouridine synthase
MRLDKIVHEHIQRRHSGDCRIQAAQKLIRSGRVVIETSNEEGNGIEERVSEAKYQVLTTIERVRVNEGGEAIVVDCQDHAFAIMNKPKGCTSGRRKEGKKEGGEERTVFDLIPPSIKERYPNMNNIGRLDLDTSGVLLFTTDGGISSLLLFPTSNVVKTYVARVEGELKDSAEREFDEGLELEDGTMTAPGAKLEVRGEGGQRAGASEGREERRTYTAAAQNWVGRSDNNVPPISLLAIATLLPYTTAAQ